jgi:hypothetical protein
MLDAARTRIVGTKLVAPVKARSVTTLVLTGVTLAP